MIDFGDIEATEEYHAEESRAADWELRASRSAKERARPPVLWAPGAGGDESQGPSSQKVHGIFYGVEFPTSVSQLEDLGASWLNAAFHAAGTLPKCTKVASLRTVRWMGTHDAIVRLLLDVEYAPRRGALHKYLLAKLSLPPESSALTTASLPPSPSVAKRPEDWIAEVNSYRLLEEATDLGMPRYYFGDVSSSTADFILITQWVPTPADGGWDPFVQGLKHVDLRTSKYDLWIRFIRTCGAVAGACKTGRLGPPELLSQALRGVVAIAGPEAADTPSDSLGVGDTDWAVRAAMAQDFIMTVASRLFPAYVKTPTAMKNFRKCLIAGKNNAKQLEWWFKLRPDYVAHGHDRLDFGSLYLIPRSDQSESGGAVQPGDEDLVLCVRDWVGFSEDCLARKLFNWMCCADREVLLYFDDIWKVFHEAYHENGGPRLDRKLFAGQFCMAVVAQSAQLVGQMEQVYRWLPKDQWNSMRHINDERLCASTSQQGSPWRFVRCFVSVTLMIHHLDVGKVVETLMPDVLSEHSWGMPLTKETVFPVASVLREGAPLHAEASLSSTLLSRLTIGMYVFCSPGATVKPDPERSSLNWVQIHMPVPGWISVKDIRELADIAAVDLPTKNKKAYAEMEFFGLMHHTRRQYTGSNPQGACVTSAMLLRNEVLIRDKHTNTLRHLGRGPCGVYLGSFLAERARRPWWPAGYKDWLHHSFLVFEDGSIADITADQFDEVPQLWFPADPNRYFKDCSKADEALKLREAFGLERWQEFAQSDNTRVARTKFKWTQAEVQRQEKYQDGKQNAAPPEVNMNVGPPGNARGEMRSQAARGALPGVRSNVSVATKAKERSTERSKEEVCQDASQAGDVLGTYHFVGDSSNWKKPARPMALRVSSSGGQQLIHRVQLSEKSKRGQLGPTVRREEFQILRDGNWDKRLYPKMSSPTPHLVLLYAGGPSSAVVAGETKDQGHGRNWALEGQVGDAINIVYDLAQGALWLEEAT